MRYQDPQHIACPRCAEVSDQPVATLLDLEAACPACKHSFRDIGEGMNSMIQAVGEFVVAMEITLFIEEADNRLVFADNDYWDTSDTTPRKYLHDVVALVQGCAARIPISSGPPPDAWTLVHAAIKKIAPSIEEPRVDMSLEMIGQAYDRREREKRQTRSTSER